MATKPLRKVRKVNAATLARTLKLMQVRPFVSAALVADRVGIHIITAQEWMRCLRKERAIHISGWAKDTLGRDASPLYALGPGLDAPRAKLTPAQRTQRYRDKLKATQGETK
jgi:hypothetical protein